MNKKTDVEIDEKLVKEIASLARLDLNEEETKMFVSQFKDILDYVSVLNEVNTDNVLPAYLSSSNKSVTREDKIEKSVSTAEFLENTPQSERGYVKVPSILANE